MNKARIDVWIFMLCVLLSCQKGESVHKRNNIDLPEKVKDLENLTVISDKKAPIYDISFKKVNTFGRSEEVLFQSVGSFAVDDKDRVYIADRHDIKVFDLNGNYIKTLGRLGRGPGEFSNMGGLILKVNSGKIYAYDDILRQINVFNIEDMEFLYSISLFLIDWMDVNMLNKTHFRNYFVINDSLILGGFNDRFSSEKSDSIFIKYYYLNHFEKKVSDEILRMPFIRFYSGNGIPSPVLLSDNAPFPNPSTRNYIIPRNDDHYLLAFTDRTSKLGQIELIYKVMDSNGNNVSNNALTFPAGFAIDTGAKSQIPKPSLPLWFMGNTVIALSKEDVLYASSTKEFLVKKYDADGVYQSAFYYPIVGPDFDLNEYLKTASSFTPKAHQIKKAFNEMNLALPKTYPIIDNIIIDDKNRIWVAILAGTERDSYEWRILKESGELIAKILLHRDQQILDIKNGYLYAKKDNGKPIGYLYSGDGSSEEDAEYIIK